MVNVFVSDLSGRRYCVNYVHVILDWIIGCNSHSNFTQFYQWVLANLMLGVPLLWTSIPYRGGGGRNTPSYLMLQKQG